MAGKTWGEMEGEGAEGKGGAEERWRGQALRGGKMAGVMNKEGGLAGLLTFLPSLPARLGDSRGGLCQPCHDGQAAGNEGLPVPPSTARPEAIAGKEEEAAATTQECHHHHRAGR